MVHKLPHMIDMARTPKDLAKDPFTPIPIGLVHDRYPCGLSISLDHVDLEKLNLEDDCEIGDLLHLFCFGKVTTVSKHDGGCRIEVQLTHIAVEDEDDENREEDREEDREEGHRESREEGRSNSRTLYGKEDDEDDED